MDARPPMAIDIDPSEVTSLQVVHLQAPGTVLESEESGPGAPARRRLTTSCKDLSVSELRLIMDAMVD